ncbi:MAG TPA: NADH-quinone oxidoreductase subunit C [Trueperaceae bacterium]|nr:NADH-quinone oxidoreductase subunit C [Trueperaceae bacterium]
MPTPLKEGAAALEALGGTRGEFLDMISVTLPKAALIDGLKALREAGLEMLTDIHGMDYLTYPGHHGKRFAVIYNVHDVAATSRLFVRVELDDGESLPTSTGLWPGAAFLERETFDMIGVEFDGHPDLRKILTPEDLDGHPHRKDFPLGETPTLFNEGRFLDPATFRAGLTGRDEGLTGWKGGTRHGTVATQPTLIDPMMARSLKREAERQEGEGEE